MFYFVPEWDCQLERTCEHCGVARERCCSCVCLCLCVCVSVTVELQSCMGGRGSQSVKITSLCYEGRDIDSWGNELLKVLLELPCHPLVSNSNTVNLSLLDCCFNFHRLLVTLPPLSPLFILSLPVSLSGECWFHKERRLHPGEDGRDVQGQGPPQNSIRPWEQTDQGHLCLRTTDEKNKNKLKTNTFWLEEEAERGAADSSLLFHGWADDLYGGVEEVLNWVCCVWVI